jgi:hypothetical protein
MNARDELIEVVLPVLEKCFESDWNMTYAEMVTDALVIAGYRKIFDGDCGLSGVKDPTEKEAAEAWMRWANLASNEDIGAIGAMQIMLTEFGYRKPRTITTAQELDALALPAIIDSPNGGMAKVEHMAGPGITQKYAEFLFGDDESADEIYTLPHFATFALPAVVLKECAP